MAMVQPKSQKARLFITHLLLLLFYRSDYVPAADGRRYLAASGKLCDRQPDPGANLPGITGNWR